MSRVTANAIQAVKQDYWKRITISFRNRINSPKFLVTMDETAVFLNYAPKRTVGTAEERTVSIRVVECSSLRFTLAVKVAMDGTKLPLFVILKAEPGGSVEKSPPSILSDVVMSCVQSKAWIDNRAMRISYTKIF